jgi:hypothetical protein
VRFVDSGHVALSIDADVDGSAGWDVWQFSVGGDYVAAVCAERVRPRAPALVVKGIVPLRSEYQLPVHNLRLPAGPALPGPNRGQ